MKDYKNYSEIIEGLTAHFNKNKSENERVIFDYTNKRHVWHLQENVNRIINREKALRQNIQNVLNGEKTYDSSQYKTILDSNRKK